MIRIVISSRGRRRCNWSRPIYRATDSFPRREIYGLTSQIRRSAISIPSNIAEGKGRDSKREYVMFLYRARGSLLEAQTQLEIACNLEYIQAEAFDGINHQCVEAGKTLNGLIASVERQINPPES